MSLTDRHIIETPEQIQLQFSVAGIGSRFLAVAFDTVIQALAGGAVALIALFLGMAGVFERWRLTSSWVAAGLIAFSFLLYFGYFAFFEIIWSGQTPGKRKVGIRVIKDTGRPLSPAESIARNLLRIVDQMPGFYAVGVVTAILNTQSKRLGDFVAGSLVVREKSLDEIQRSWEAAPSSRPAPVLGANRLTLEEIGLIDAFLARRHDLAPDVRYRMAHEILRRIESKLTLSDEDRAGVERILQAVAHEYRASGRY